MAPRPQRCRLAAPRGVRVTRSPAKSWTSARAKLRDMAITPETVRALAQLNLNHEPIAIAFLTEPPETLPRVSRADAASCGYWRQASEGHAFYTTGDDHQNCPVGAFTHGAPMSPA